MLARFYATGFGTEKDFEKATEIRKALCEKYLSAAEGAGAADNEAGGSDEPAVEGVINTSEPEDENKITSEAQSDAAKDVEAEAEPEAAEAAGAADDSDPEVTQDEPGPSGETGAEAASAVLEERRAAWPLKTPPVRKGILKRYTQFAESAMKGAGY